MSTYKLTSLSLNEDDVKLRQKLKGNGISLIETWRFGAQKLLDRKSKNRNK